MTILPNKYFKTFKKLVSPLPLSPSPSPSLSSSPLPSSPSLSPSLLLLNLPLDIQWPKSGEISAEARDLISKLLVRDPKKRLGTTHGKETKKGRGRGERGRGGAERGGERGKGRGEGRGDEDGREGGC